MSIARFMPLAALLALAGCAYGGATGYAPEGYPAGYDDGMGSGMVAQPGDRFGASNVASIDVFTAPLSPYGQWVNSRYGRAFRPDVPREWRPYVNGQWGENRLWISNDPWGWATDHYGRWGFDDRIGWVWAPGTEWAPSWVAWRENPGQNVAGWAPVPPGVNYSINLGFGSGFGFDNFANWYGPSWVWVPQNYLFRPGFGGRVLPWHYGANYWGGSRWNYQPGFGGRPRFAYRPQFGNQWQGQPQFGGWQGKPQFGNWQGRQQRNWQGQPQFDNWQGRQRGNWQGQPRPGLGYDRARPQYDGRQGQPGRREPIVRGDEQMNGRGRGILAGDATVQALPRMESQPQYQQRPAPSPERSAERAERQAQRAEGQSQRAERQDLQRQVQAQSYQRNDEGNTRPD